MNLSFIIEHVTIKETVWSFSFYKGEIKWVKA